MILPAYKALLWSYLPIRQPPSQLKTKNYDLKTTYDILHTTYYILHTTPHRLANKIAPPTLHNNLKSEIECLQIWDMKFEIWNSLLFTFTPWDDAFTISSGLHACPEGETPATRILVAHLSPWALGLRERRPRTTSKSASICIKEFSRLHKWGIAKWLSGRGRSFCRCLHRKKIRTKTQKLAKTLCVFRALHRW